MLKHHHTELQLVPSGGNQQKSLLVVGLTQPEILMLDEPTLWYRYWGKI